jgi:hypothetical protein
MTSELIKTLPTDNFALAAANSTSIIVGVRLRFAKGVYLVGRGDGERLPPGSTFHVLDVQGAWVKFIDGQIVDQRVGFPQCNRADLDDADEADWPLGIDGKPADPWLNQRYLYLLDPRTGAEYTFVTSSGYGRGAVQNLARAISMKRATVPGAIAVVRLDIDYKKHLKYGNVLAPKFPIVGYAGDGVPPAGPRAPLSQVIDDGSWEIDDDPFK